MTSFFQVLMWLVDVLVALPIILLALPLYLLTLFLRKTPFWGFCAIVLLAVDEVLWGWLKPRTLYGAPRPRPPKPNDELRPTYWLGYGACRDGAGNDTNPYKVTEQSGKWMAWWCGWIDGYIEGKTRGTAGHWWASQTFWYGLLMILIGVIGALQEQLISTYPQIASGLFAVCGLLVIVKRVLDGSNRGPAYPQAAPILAGGKDLSEVGGETTAPPHRPAYGLCLPATLHRVIDGDTVEVSVGGQLLWTVRLMEIDAPELRSPGGSEAKSAAERLMTGKQLAVWIPVPGDLRHLLRSLSFERVPAHVYLDEEVTLSDEMRGGGYAHPCSFGKGEPW
jgi:hypothetical protein